MTSEHPIEQLSAAIDDELGAAERDRLDAHLASCEGCAAELEALRRTRDALGSLPLADGSAVVDGFLARHRTAVRSAASFAGVALVVIGALALTASVATPAVVPDIDHLVAAHDARDPEPMLGAAVPEPTGLFDAPSVLTDGRSRRVVYGDADTTAVVYSRTDGRAPGARVSVFQQYGRVQWSGLEDGVVVEVGGRRAWRRAATPPVVLVAESGHLVLTIVAPDDATAVMALEQMPAPERSGHFERFHDACQRLTEVFGLSG